MSFLLACRGGWMHATLSVACFIFQEKNSCLLVSYRLCSSISFTIKEAYKMNLITLCYFSYGVQKECIIMKKRIIYTNSFPTLWSESSLLYIPWVFSSNTGEGRRRMKCWGEDKGVCKSMEGQSTEVACLTFTHSFSYWAAAVHGWHWNTRSTVSQAVHVKNPGTRKHYSLNMTFYH